LEGGYLRVVQDVRGKHGSEGDYVVNRPLRGPLNKTPVDHATDTFDTIDWLVKNVPQSNGKVGILGISYDGFLPLMALVNRHPANDACWQDQAVDKVLARQPLQTPVMLVHSLWDQEDIYGAPAVYRAIKPKDGAGDKVFLIIGPWHHGQMIGNGSALGAVKF